MMYHYTRKPVMNGDDPSAYIMKYSSKFLSFQWTIICSVEFINFPLEVDVGPWNTSSLLAGFAFCTRIYRHGVVYYGITSITCSSIWENPS